MYDYSYNYNYNYDIGEGAGILAAVSTTSLIISSAISVLMIISLWKIFEKLGKEGWISLIPFYNMWTLLELCDMKGWLIFIPFANIICMLIAYYRLPLKLGYTSGFGVLNIFFPAIVMPILAFKKGPNMQYNNYTNTNPQNNINNNYVNTNSQNDINNNEQVSSQNFKFCTSCGTKCAFNAKFCDNCGKEF